MSFFEAFAHSQVVLHLANIINEKMEGEKKNPTSKIQIYIYHSLLESRKLIWVLRVWFHRVVSGRYLSEYPET